NWACSGRVSTDMETYNISYTFYSIVFDARLDDRVRTKAPVLRGLVEKEVEALLKQPGQQTPFHPSREELTRHAHRYGEQYAEDPFGDLDRYFDILNGRFFSRDIPT